MTPDSPALFLGIDVGKDRLDLALVDADGHAHVKHVRDDSSGRTALVRWLGRFADHLGAVHACLEASGGYEDDAAAALHGAGLAVPVANPRRTAAYASVQLRPRLSKAGNARLRRAPYWPAISAIQHNEAMSVFAARLSARGRSKMSVIGASMRKLLQICYGVPTSGRPSDASLHPAA